MTDITTMKTEVLPSVAIEPEYGTIAWITYKVERAESDLRDVAYFIWKQAQAYNCSFNKMIEQYRNEGAVINVSDRTLYRRLEALPEYQKVQVEKKLNPSKQTKYERRKQEVKVCQTDKTLPTERGDNCQFDKSNTQEVEVVNNEPELSLTQSSESWADDNQVPLLTPIKESNFSTKTEVPLVDDGLVDITLRVSPNIYKLLKIFMDERQYEGIKDVESFILAELESLYECNCESLSDDFRLCDHFTKAELEELNLENFWDDDEATEAREAAWQENQKQREQEIQKLKESEAFNDYNSYRLVLYPPKGNNRESEFVYLRPDYIETLERSARIWLTEVDIDEERSLPWALTDAMDKVVELSVELREVNAKYIQALHQTPPKGANVGFVETALAADDNELKELIGEGVDYKDLGSSLVKLGNKIKKLIP